MANLNQSPIFFANPADNTNPGVIVLAGDLGGAYGAPTVLKLNGVILPTAAPTAGQTMVAIDATHLGYQTPSGGSTTQIAMRPVTMTYGATVTPNVDTTDIMRLTLTGNAVIANPTGTPVSGQRLVMEISQDSTGARTVTWGNAYVFSTDIPSPTLTTTANKRDKLLYQWNSAISKWDFCGIIKGF